MLAVPASLGSAAGIKAIEQHSAGVNDQVCKKLSGQVCHCRRCMVSTETNTLLASSTAEEDVSTGFNQNSYKQRWPARDKKRRRSSSKEIHTDSLATDSLATDEQWSVQQWIDGMTEAIGKALSESTFAMNRKRSIEKRVSRVQCQL